MYYFAYGSNMNLEHMRRMCGWHCHVLDVATLPDFELGLDLRGFLNIRQMAEKKVMGVLFEIDQHCLDALDEFEGYPEVYTRQEVKVIDSEGQEKIAWVFIEAGNEFGGTHTKEEFMRRVIIGARENKLPETWIKFLQSFKIR